MTVKDLFYLYIGLALEALLGIYGGCFGKVQVVEGIYRSFSLKVVGLCAASPKVAT